MAKKQSKIGNRKSAMTVPVRFGKGEGIFPLRPQKDETMFEDLDEKMKNSRKLRRHHRKCKIWLDITEWWNRVFHKNQ